MNEDLKKALDLLGLRALDGVDEELEVFEHTKTIFNNLDHFVRTVNNLTDSELEAIREVLCLATFRMAPGGP